LKEGDTYIIRSLVSAYNQSKQDKPRLRELFISSFPDMIVRPQGEAVPLWISESLMIELSRRAGGLQKKQGLDLGEDGPIDEQID
jgi:hypothetical protein